MKLFHSLDTLHYIAPIGSNAAIATSLIKAIIIQLYVISLGALDKCHAMENLY